MSSELSNVYCYVFNVLGKCNLYGEVTQFRKQEQHSKNFEELMDWLRDLIKLCENPRHSEITAHMLIKSDEATVKITAKVTNDDCRICSWEWQGENES